MSSAHTTPEARYRVSVELRGELVDVFDALVALAEEPAHQVAARVLEEGLARAGHDPDVEQLVRARRRRRKPRLRLVPVQSTPDAPAH